MKKFLVTFTCCFVTCAFAAQRSLPKPPAGTLSIGAGLLAAPPAIVVEPAVSAQNAAGAPASRTRSMSPVRPGSPDARVGRGSRLVVPPTLSSGAATAGPSTAVPDAEELHRAAVLHRMCERPVQAPGMTKMISRMVRGGTLGDIARALEKKDIAFDKTNDDAAAHQVEAIGKLLEFFRTDFDEICVNADMRNKAFCVLARLLQAGVRISEELDEKAHGFMEKYQAVLEKEKLAFEEASRQAIEEVKVMNAVLATRSGSTRPVSPSLPYARPVSALKVALRHASTAAVQQANKQAKQ